jgi:hypothetical protein
MRGAANERCGTWPVSRRLPFGLGVSAAMASTKPPFRLVVEIRRLCTGIGYEDKEAAGSHGRQNKLWTVWQCELPLMTSLAEFVVSHPADVFSPNSVCGRLGRVSEPPPTTWPPSEHSLALLQGQSRAVVTLNSQLCQLQLDRLGVIPVPRTSPRRNSPVSTSGRGTLFR